MRKLPLMFAVGLLSAGLILGGCEKEHREAHANMWASVTHAVAVLEPTAGNNVTGVIMFEQMGDHVHVTGTITGLTPGQHGFHIHEFGDLSSKDGTAAGGHYNPEGHPHGEMNGAMSHAGDMGNVTADATGTATVDLMVHGISIAGMKDPIIGRGLVVHAKQDDFSQPTGNAGARVAVGVIGIAK
jgi:superoxide dismutase, Cu-Zn family